MRHGLLISRQRQPVIHNGQLHIIRFAPPSGDLHLEQIQDFTRDLGDNLLLRIERKYIKSALNGKLEGSNEYNEYYVKAIEKAESLETHKELQKINNLAFSLMYYIENLNELKNIRTKENFKLI